MQPEATTQPAVEAAGKIGLTTDRLAEIFKQGIGLDDLLTVCRHTNAAVAVLMILAGIIFLMWGFYAFKSLVLLNAACLGGWLGYLVGHKQGGAVPAAAVGAFVAAAITWPLMKYAVAVMGGLIGTVIGMTVWRTAGLDPSFAASGGGMGLIFFGMISFILFRTSVMMFTSIQGAAMLIFGLLCVVYKLSLFDAKSLDTKLLLSPAALPVAIALAAIVGVLYQNHDIAKPAAAPAK
ncbi:MAG: hypothetical protein QM754_15095 [Tepidisphaeraceae bacterium]